MHVASVKTHFTGKGLSAAYFFLGKMGQIRSLLRVSLPRSLRMRLLDLVDLTSGSSKHSIPPLRLRHIIGQDIGYDGEGFVQLLREDCALMPNQRILDIGSGTGRIASALTGYLNEDGRYEGLEIVGEFVDWCQQNISTKYPNFKFKRADVFSGSYNPHGAFKASEYRFPYDDASFDVVCLSSVFTHMLPRDMENYIREIVRVLKPNGRCWITYYLINDESRRFAALGANTRSFMDCGEYYTADKEVPENAIGYEEQRILKLYEESGLQVESPVCYGSWSGRKSEGIQDIIVARKTVYPSLKMVTAEFDAAKVIAPLVTC